MAIKGKGSPIHLPYNTSLLVYSDPSRLPQEREEVRGIQVMPLAYALCKVQLPIFNQHHKMRKLLSNLSKVHLICFE